MSYPNYLPITTWPLGWHTMAKFKPEIRNVLIEMQDCSPLLTAWYYFALPHLLFRFVFVVSASHINSDKRREAAWRKSHPLAVSGYTVYQGD